MLNTDTEILIKNTDEGPASVDDRKAMQWTVEPDSAMPFESLLCMKSGG